MVTFAQVVIYDHFGKAVCLKRMIFSAESVDDSILNNALPHMVSLNLIIRDRGGLL